MDYCNNWQKITLCLQAKTKYAYVKHGHEHNVIHYNSGDIVVTMQSYITHIDVQQNVLSWAKRYKGPLVVDRVLYGYVYRIA